MYGCITCLFVWLACVVLMLGIATSACCWGQDAVLLLLKLAMPYAPAQAYRPIMRSFLDAAQAAAPRAEEGEIDAAGGGANGPDAQGDVATPLGSKEATAAPAVAPAATGLPTSWAQALATFDAYEPNKVCGWCNPIATHKLLVLC
jgi:hypothetical protein